MSIVIVILLSVSFTSISASPETEQKLNDKIKSLEKKIKDLLAKNTKLKTENTKLKTENIKLESTPALVTSKCDPSDKLSSLSKCDLYKFPAYVDSFINYGDYHNRDLSYANLIDAYFSKANLSGANLKFAKIIGCIGVPTGNQQTLSLPICIPVP